MKRNFLGSLCFFLLIFTIILTLTSLPTNAAEQSNQKGASEGTAPAAPAPDALSKEDFVDRVIDETWEYTDPSGKEQKAPKTKEELKKEHGEEEDAAEWLL